MEILFRRSLIILVIVSLVQTEGVAGNSVSGGIFKVNAGELEVLQENANTNKDKMTAKRQLPRSLEQDPEYPIEASTCPDDSTISPCYCDIRESLLEIDCFGSTVKQTTLENVFQEIRRANGIPVDGAVHIEGLSLRNTLLTQLDLAPFYESRFVYLNIYNNNNLTKLIASGNPGDQFIGSIHVERLYLASCPINREGFGNALKYFSNEMINFHAEKLDLNNSNDSVEVESEFLPGLSTLTKLMYLRVHHCKISGRLNPESWNFTALQSLQYIYLTNNNITEIGEGVFHLDRYDNPDHLDIDLNGNKLNETSFHPNSGITRAGRKTTLWLTNNQIASLPAPIFETFLDAHPESVLQLLDNPLICDERLSWVKSRRDEFQNRVPQARCSNDRDHTVFDSDLIP